MTNTHYNIIFKSIDDLNKQKLSEVLPALQIVAKQNNLCLSKSNEFRQAKRILEVSIINN